MPVWSRAVASGTDLSRLTIGLASTVSELYRAPPTAFRTGAVAFDRAPCSNIDYRFAHASNV
jgi:hypothetical protein